MFGLQKLIENPNPSDCILVGEILMTNQSVTTVGTTVRLYRTQMDSLRTVYPELSTSALVRALLTLYLGGKIPDVYPLALKEMARAEQALKSNKTKQVSVV
jgi:hypothetical protein